MSENAICPSCRSYTLCAQGTSYCSCIMCEGCYNEFDEEGKCGLCHTDWREPNYAHYYDSWVEPRSSLVLECTKERIPVDQVTFLEIISGVVRDPLTYEFKDILTYECPECHTVHKGVILG